MKKRISFLLAFCLLLFTVIPSFAVMAAENELADGKYTIQLNVLAADEDKVSSMARYVVNPATLEVNNGKITAAVTLSGSSMITGFRTQNAGEFVETKVISEDKAADQRTVTFAVEDLSAIMNAQVDVYVAANNYKKTHDVRLSFDTATIEKQQETTPAVQLEDGKYSIQLNVLAAEEDKASSMGRYVVNPATLEVDNGKITAAVTLSGSSMITGFRTQYAGDFVDTKVVSEDKAADQRTVAFEVEDLSAIMNAQVDVYVAANNYKKTHDVRLSFDTTTIQEKAGFKDIESSWAKQYIEALAEKTIITGVSADLFNPKGDVTRAQFAVMITRALSLPMETYAGTFSDVPATMTWAAQSIEAANRAGIVFGNNGKFEPNDLISREQMATMVIRAIEYKNASILENVDKALSFIDAASISSFAKDYVAFAAGLGIIDGIDVTDGKAFKPEDKANREQAAKVIYLLLEKLN